MLRSSRALVVPATAPPSIQLQFVDLLVPLHPATHLGPQLPLERFRGLVQLLQDETPADTDFIHWEGEYAVPPEADVLINATPVGLFPNVQEMPPVALESIRPDLLVCDVIPNPPQTAFLRAAAARGARTLNGLGMLVYQGAICFEMWTEVKPPIPVMRKALQEAFGA